MKKVLINLLILIMITLSLSMFGCGDGQTPDPGPEQKPPAPITNFSVSIDGKVSFDSEADTVYYLYRGQDKLSVIENGDDITALVTQTEQTFTVKTGERTSNGVKVYKPAPVTNLTFLGTTITFSTQNGVTYKLSVNGESMGEITSGSDIKGKIGVGVYSVFVYTEGKIANGVVELNSRSNTVNLNTKGDNDLSYDNDWLK